LGDSPSGLFAVWPVLGSGQISRCEADDSLFHPHEEVDVINPKGLGITEVKWTDEAP